MDVIEGNDKVYELISTKKNPLYESMLKAIDLIKEFISKRQLIVYGGTAIDYALRLHNDNIYPDDQLSVPDLDFYSNDNVKDAYDLADILYKNGFEKTRAIRALYVRTMRVDIGENNFLADITYMPAGILLPTIQYEKMKIIHPDFQRLDIHMALSFPLSNAPMEAIFGRLKKDIKRFNLLDKYYPLGSGLNLSGKPLTLKKYNIPIKFKDYVFTGMAAYAIICLIVGGNEPNAAEISKQITFNTLVDEVEIVNSDVDELIKSLTDIKKYNKYINLLPARILAKKDGIQMNIHNITGKRIAAHMLTYKEHKIKITNVQYILLNFLAKAYLTDGNTRATYVFLYNDLMRIINTHCCKHEFLMPTYKTYGGVNLTEANEINLNRIQVDLHVEGINQYNMPEMVYSPARGNRPSAYDYNEKFFHIDGSEKENKNGDNQN